MLPSLLQFGWSLRPCLSFNFLSVLLFDKKRLVVLVMVFYWMLSMNFLVYVWSIISVGALCMCFKVMDCEYCYLYLTFNSQVLISALYILFACLYHMLPHLSFSLHFSLLISSLTYLFLWEKTCSISRPDVVKKVVLVFLCLFCVVVCFIWLVNACSCCVWFSFFSCQAKRLAWRNVSQNDLFCVEWDVKPQLNQLVI